MQSWSLAGQVAEMRQKPLPQTAGCFVVSRSIGLEIERPVTNVSSITSQLATILRTRSPVTTGSRHSITSTSERSPPRTVPSSHARTARLTPTAIAISTRCMGKVFLALAPDAKFGRPELISHRSVASGCVRPVCERRGRDH
jgi:hypothetical protein